MENSIPINFNEEKKGVGDYLDRREFPDAYRHILN